MADNVTIKDSAAADKVMRTTDASGVHTPHHIVSSLPALVAGTANIGKVVLVANAVDVATGAPLPVGDGGGSLTVDGTVGIAAGGSSGGLVIGTTLTGAGEAHIGQVGGVNAQPTAAPTGSTTPAYSSGDAVGSAYLTFTNAARISAGSGIVNSGRVTCKSAQTAPFDLYLFNAAPSGSTVTDNGAFSLAVADLPQCIGVLRMNDVISSGLATIMQAENAGKVFKIPSGTSLFGILVIRGTATLASTSDLAVILDISQD